jgi:hypothetical protein
MNVDISRMLESPSGIAIQLLYSKGLVLTNYQKIILVDHWNKLGSPETFRDPLVSILGKDSNLFLNPYLGKLLDTSFYTLLANTRGFESLEKPEYREIIKAVFDKKLEILESEVARTGYKSEIIKSSYSSTSQSLIFELKSRVMPYELYHFSATVQGYTYTPSIRLFNRPEELTHLLTDQSITNLKGIMFYMTENEEWDKSLLPRTMKFIKFKSIILSSLSDSIIDKYYKPELEENLRPKEDDEDTSVGLNLLDDDEDDDEDDDIYGSGFNLDDY